MFTHVLIRVPSRSPIHAESESSTDEDNIFAISTPIVKGTSWNLHDLTSHRQGVFEEEEIIYKDFTQSYWLALQFWVQPNRIFTVGVPQASHGIKDFLSTHKIMKYRLP